MTLQDAMAAYNPQALMPREDPEAEIQRWMRHRGTPPFVSSPEWEEAQRRQMMNPILGLLMRLGGPGQQQQRTLASYSSNPYSGNNTFRGGY